MDNVAVSRQNHTNKGNKENAQPTYGGKSVIHRNKTSVVPFQLKNNDKEKTFSNVPLDAKAKRVDTRSASGEAPKKVKTAQKNGKGVADVKQKTVSEAPKPPAAVPPTKCAPGMYKGKIVQSKIGSIWKSSATVGGADSEPSEHKVESQRVANATKSRTKSARDLPERGTQRPAAASSKSVFSKPPQESKHTVTTRPPARTVPATLTRTNLRNTTVAPTKGSGTQNSRPKSTVTDKVSKPPVSSSMSQYRLKVETAEEKRAKLAEWLASKGKTLKRPAMTAALQSKTNVSAKPEAELKSQSHVEPPSAVQCRPKPEPSLDADTPDSATAAHCADPQGAQLPRHSRTPALMDTSLELLEGSDADLPIDTRESVDDIVVNLSEALEAMATPSRCSDEQAQAAEECDDEMEQNRIKEEMLKDVEKVKNELEKSDGLEVETNSAEELESDDGGVTSPPMECASVVKYSVKTTPYLQSVKKTIVDEASTSTSRRKSNIKDLKFLTPVRRSCRIQRKSARLPKMLVDHDPCVSSLAELVKLDDNPNAYIYRKNLALVEDLPDQPGL